jgi:hypothetical protein
MRISSSGPDVAGTFVAGSGFQGSGQRKRGEIARDSAYFSQSLRQSVNTTVGGLSAASLR